MTSGHCRFEAFVFMVNRMACGCGQRLRESTGIETLLFVDNLPHRGIAVISLPIRPNDLRLSDIVVGTAKRVSSTFRESKCSAKAYAYLDRTSLDSIEGIEFSEP